MADLKPKQFFGTAQTVISTTTDIASGNFSGTPTTFDNTTDSSVPYAPYAQAMLEIPDWGAAPAIGTAVELWGLLIDTDGTDDDTTAPSGSSSNGARFFGAWPAIPQDAALQRSTINIDLAGVEKVNFYIRNGTAQNMNNDGGTACVLKIRPYTIGVTT